ncbi:MAG: ABC transporter permease [Spirochaetaceae bacterium]
MSLPNLAWKNMLRYGRRTAITAAAIAVGLVAYIAMDSLLVGMDLESERNLIWYETGTAKVLHEGYWEEHEELPLDLAIAEPERLVEDLEEAGVPATPRIVFQAELVVRRNPYPEDGSLQVRGYGVDPDRDGTVFRIDEHLVAGRRLKPGEAGVVLGAILADRLGAEVGFPLIIVTRTAEGYFQTIDAEVVGIVKTPNPVVDRSSVYLPLDVARLYLQMEDKATEIALRLPETAKLHESLSQARGAIGAGAGELSVLSWRELAADYVALAETKKSGSGIILFLVFVIAVVGISNTMIMAVFERTREIGTLRALGMPDRRVRLLFLYEAGAVGFLGSIAGLIVGAGVVYALVRWGIDYSAMLENMDIGYRTAGIMRGAWNPAAFVRALVSGVLVSAASAYLPTNHAVRRSVPDCLRYQR